MSRISKPYTFVNNTQTADGTQVNANFDAIFNDYNGNVTSDNFATNGFSDSTKLANEVVAQTKTKGVVYTQDLFSGAFVLSGGVATKDGTTANILDVTAIVAYTLQSDGSYRRISNVATSFTTNVVSTTYYLDLNPDGSWWWGTAHTSQQNYLAVAQATTDSSGNISAVTDERNLNPAFNIFKNVDTWHTLTLLNGVTNVGSPYAPNVQYRKDANGFVHLRGAVTIPSGFTIGTALGTLPAGYRPAYQEIFSDNSGASGNAGRFDIDASGNIKPQVFATGQYMSMNVAPFLAEN